MRHIFAIITFCFLAFTAHSQNVFFEHVASAPPAAQNFAYFDGVKYGSTAVADIDGDQDLDIIMTGESSYDFITIDLYTNNGNGTFQLVTNTPFQGVLGSVAFADIDGDNDQDLLICGYRYSSSVCELYTNDGLGNFSLVEGTPFQGLRGNSVFADVDGDNDMDLLISGSTGWNSGITLLYTNDGMGNFTLIENTPMPDLRGGSIAFTDIDGDNDQDLLITGENSDDQKFCKLYINDGIGNFTVAPNTTFPGIRSSSVSFADIDGDNDDDLLIAGISDTATISQLYSNDGLGNFVLIEDTSIPGFSAGFIQFGDVDGDQDQDLLISGSIGSVHKTELYINDGIGVFSQNTETPIENGYIGTVNFLDMDGDNDLDILQTGGTAIGSSAGAAYLNDGTGVYTKWSNDTFTGVYYSSIAFADIDGDNDQDVLITGDVSYNDPLTELYINDGLGGYSLVSGTPFQDVFHSSIAFADVDGDGDQDVVITGLNSNSEGITELYANDGNGNFTLVSDTPFQGIYSGAVSFGDVDGDNDLDLLISGLITSSQKISELFINDGTGGFTLQTDTPFQGAGYGSIAFADVDGDTDLDVFIYGIGSSNNNTELYINDGTGNYSLSETNEFPEVVFGVICVGDVDGDNDPDLITSGFYYSGGTATKTLINDGSGIYSLSQYDPLEGLTNSTINLVDVDGDGDQDLHMTGHQIPYTSSYQAPHASNLYMNDGTGFYSLVENTLFPRTFRGSVAFADIDGDNDPDFLCTGANDNFSPTPSTYLWRNVTCLPKYTIENSTICLDESITVNGNVYDANTPIGTETFEGAEANGCDSIVHVNLEVIPNLFTTTIGATIYVSDDYSDYQWLDCDDNFSPISGANDPNFTPIENGNYAVEITENGCSAISDCVSITTVGIHENSFDNQFVVYPNPTNGGLTIEFDQPQETMTIRVYSVLGQELESMEYQNTDHIQFDLNQPNGIYLLELQDADGHQSVIRLVKN